MRQCAAFQVHQPWPEQRCKPDFDPVKETFLPVKQYLIGHKCIQNTSQPTVEGEEESKIGILRIHSKCQVW